MRNIFLIVIDAVRHYDSGKDERDRLRLFDELSQNDFLTFNKMVVSAPSSIMSAVTMFTGEPSFDKSRTYDEFDWNAFKHMSFTEQLIQGDYLVSGCFAAREMREKMAPLIPFLPSLPLGIKHNDASWSNRQVAEAAAAEILRLRSVKKDFFFIAWFNSRYDTSTSETVAEFLRKNVLVGEDKNNSMVMVTADHGYPDQIRGLTSDGPDLKKAGKPHDLIMTDDNICVPFSIRCPLECGGTIRDLVLGKFYPSIVDEPLTQCCIKEMVLEFAFGAKTETNVLSTNLVNKTPIRSDARFIFQPGRICSMRTNCKKLIIDRDQELMFAYDLLNDPQELTPIPHSEFDEELWELKKLIEDQDRDAIAVWYDQTRARLSSFAKPHESVSLVYFGSSLHLRVVVECLLEHPVALRLFVPEVTLKKIEMVLGENISNERLTVELSTPLTKSMPTFIIVEDVFAFAANTQWIQMSRSIDAIIFDINLKKYKTINDLVLKTRIRRFSRPFRRMAVKKHFYRKNPRVFMYDLVYIFIRALKLICRRVC